MSIAVPEQDFRKLSKKELAQWVSIDTKKAVRMKFDVLFALFFEEVYQGEISPDQVYRQHAEKLSYTQAEICDFFGLSKELCIELTQSGVLPHTLNINVRNGQVHYYPVYPPHMLLELNIENITSIAPTI